VFKTSFQLIRPAATTFVLLTVLTGAIYPAVVTGIAQIAFPAEANGSLIVRDGKVIGSALIGQAFTKPENFWSRPSATGPMPYNVEASSGSNLGPTNPALIDAVKARVEALKAADPGNTKPIPVDLVTASASGLDPHISRAAADYQASRVAVARKLPLEKVIELIDAHTEKPLLGFLGEARVNVLTLNIALAATKIS
jgi:K+-transporting ATPase ATPase C chain